MMVLNPNFMCLDTYGSLKWWKFFIFSKSKIGGTNTICCIKLFADTFGAMAKVQSKYNVIILKLKTLLELKVDFM